MRLVFLAMTFLISGSAVYATEECPAFLIYEIAGLARADQAAAQRYASCVSHPWLPLAQAAEAKFAECGENVAANTSENLVTAMNWVNHIANGFGGCETRLEIRKKR